MSTNIATAIPQLNSGEIYAGAIIQPNGSLSHIILLPEQLTSVNFPDAQQWALKFRWAGMTTLASLPTKNELEHLFAMSRAAKARGDSFYDFQLSFYYWSSDQYACHVAGTMSKLILSGGYQPGPEGTFIRACAIRRVAV